MKKWNSLRGRRQLVWKTRRRVRLNERNDIRITILCFIKGKQEEKWKYHWWGFELRLLYSYISYKPLEPANLLSILNKLYIYRYRKILKLISFDLSPSYYQLFRFIPTVRLTSSAISNIDYYYLTWHYLESLFLINN